jgi:hypothetical protein
MTTSPKQASFIASLLNDRQPDEHLRVEAQMILDGGGDRAIASGIIERLLNAPRRPKAPSIGGKELPRVEVPAGRYALPSDYDPDGTPVFYKVDEGKVGGKWEGFVFVSRLAGPNEDRIRDAKVRQAILVAIKTDVEGALRRYGHLSGCCGRCNTELTDKFSRFIGVGPVCREALGLPKSEAAFVRDGGVLPDEYLREVEHEAAQAREDARQRAAEARDEDYVYGDADGTLDHEAGAQA